MRKKRREEEREILKKMEETIEEEKAGAETPLAKTEKKQFFGILEDNTPGKVHCRRCKTLMEKGVCPVCGFHIYIPMDEGKKKKVRLIIGGVCFALFLVLFIVGALR